MMKILFERSGGFAGLRMTVTVELSSLPAEEADALQKLVDNVDFFNITAARPARVTQDGFQYSITIESTEQRRTITVSESAVSERLRPLLDELSLRARSQRRSS